MEESEHFHHWLQNLADETGFTGDHNHVDMKVDWAHELGVTDEELLTYRPMAETVGAVYTTLYYMRRSYEEGLAAFGWAGERFAASLIQLAIIYAAAAALVVCSALCAWTTPGRAATRCWYWTSAGHGDRSTLS